MIKPLLIVSHLGSGSDIFCRFLEKNPRIQVFKPDIIYSHPFDLEKLLGFQHKLGTSKSIWADEILYDHYFSGKSLYNFFKFIFIIRNPKHTLPLLMKNFNIHMVNYYLLRLRRIYEMVRDSSGLCFSIEEINKNVGLIEEYLGLVEPLGLMESIPIVSNLLPGWFIDKVENYYEKYYSKLLDIRNEKFL